MKFSGCILQIMKKNWKISSEDTWGLDYQTFTNWKKVTQKMKSHSKSEVHLLSCQLDVETDRTWKKASIISQLQNVGEQQRFQNGKVFKVLIWCTHYLAHQHIAHITNFDKLVD